MLNGVITVNFMKGSDAERRSMIFYTLKYWLKFWTGIQTV